MPVHNNWYNLAATRSYPLADSATGIDDNGVRMPNDILVDVHLRWPEDYGKFAYVAGLTVTDKLVTCVIAAASAEDNPDIVHTIATISLVQPVAAGVNHALVPAVEGAAGFIVFEDVSEPGAYRFTSPRQSRLCPRVAATSIALPIPTLRKFGRADGLTGLVKLRADTNVRLERSTQIWLGQPRDGVEIHVVSPPNDTRFMSDLAGPCGKRPESRTCAREPIETLNGLAPDCDGNIDLMLVDLSGGPYEPTVDGAFAGITLDQPLEMADVCSPRLIPRRFVGTPYCNYDSSVSSGSSGSSVDDGDDSDPCTLPYESCMELIEADPVWTIVRGQFVPGVTGGRPSSLGCPPSYDGTVSTDLSDRNILLFDCDLGGSHFGVNAVTVMERKTSTKKLGGLIFNYKRVANTDTYWLFTMDFNLNRVEIARWTGSLLVPELSVDVGLNLLLSTWHMLSIQVGPADGGAVEISGAILAKNGTTQVFELITDNYGEPTGKYGLYADKSKMMFSWFAVE